MAETDIDKSVTFETLANALRTRMRAEFTSRVIVWSDGHAEIDIYFCARRVFGCDISTSERVFSEPFLTYLQDGTL